MQRVVLSPVYAIVVLSQVQNVVVSPVYAIVVLSQVQNVVLSPWTPIRHSRVNRNDEKSNIFQSKNL